MEIEFSRHAKRRMKLYDLSEDIVYNILKSVKDDSTNEIIRKVHGFEYPIKVVFKKKMNLILVITVYPLKRAYR